MNDGLTNRVVQWDELGFYKCVYTRKGTIRKFSPEVSAAKALIKLSKSK